MSSSFGDFLRRLRKQKKRTQRDLASEVGVNYTYLSKLENDAPGFASVSEGTLLKLADALDADSDEVITRAGKVPSDIQRILIDDFSLIREIRGRVADDSAGDENAGQEDAAKEDTAKEDTAAENRAEEDRSGKKAGPGKPRQPGR